MLFYSDFLLQRIGIELNEAFSRNQPISLYQ